MTFHYKRNRFFFMRADLWSILTFSLFAAIGVLILCLGGWNLSPCMKVVVVVLLASAAVSAASVFFSSSKTYIRACIDEAYRLSYNEIVAIHQIPSDDVGSHCCFLRIQPPKGCRPKQRGGILSDTYLVGVLTCEGRLVFEIRGVSLISKEIYRKRVRFPLAEVQDVSFEPDHDHPGERGTLTVAGSQGQSLFSCRCDAGYPVRDFTEFIRARIH